MNEIQKFIANATPKDLKAFFAFRIDDNDDLIIGKFNIWCRYFFPKYFTSDDADFHDDIDRYNVQAYKGTLSSFVNIGFRGCAKTARTKLFIAYCIANDIGHYRKFIKVLSEDFKNATTITTDIYNMLASPGIVPIYSEIFQKTDKKREERMSVFTTFTGVKVQAGTVGMNQRGALQEASRPDFVWFEDFENRKTVSSAVTSRNIWDNMEEARTGLSKDGSCLYTCNYISERGNVHKLVINEYPGRKVLITPIIIDGKTAWDRYSMEDIEQMKKEDEDFEGERMCKPSASGDILFDREIIDAMPVLEPVREVAGFKILKPYDPSHRYASGHDIAGGVGYDSSTSVFIDFDTIPAQVVATYANNKIKPDVFGDEIARQADKYGECLVAPEKNNHGHATIGRLKQIYNTSLILETPGKELKIDDDHAAKEFGWHTNAITKPKMLFDLAKAIDDGLLILNDEGLIREARSYSRDDLMDRDVDVRLSTRHFDKLIACAIAWQMKDYVDLPEKEKARQQKLQEELEQLGFDPFSVV